MSQPDTFGFSDEELATLATAYRSDLFKDQVVLVTGAATGIGKGIASLFARLGATLVIASRSEEKLAAAKPYFEQFGHPVETRAMTIRDPEQVEALMDFVWERFGRLDVLVNNGGGQFPANALDISPKGWNAVVDTNLNGTWYMMQSAAKHWVEHQQPGRIVNIVAVYQRGIPQLAHTCAARAGVTYLSRTLAVEWAPHDIRVNCVAPGCVESSGFAVYPEEGRDSYYEKPNLKKGPGDVHDVAEAVVYLASDSSKFITGELIDVDGGQRLWGEMWPAGLPDYYDV